ncbi:O-antigen ligase family protein [Demequina sp. SYSU T00192]|uniref:O-antigen ligase family protein n=1 Tax=Demequina litoralis TaxID=3051660 RepID=A0ABT8G8F1_9MICO|nr:O-antigen ligase family protein [Demequina sp. SYSU T00192]MDN4475424.1 O-antigen ligase family protein [Demequina sp. SYSU T00192]
MSALIWAALATGFIALFLPARPPVRAGAALLVALVVMAVFPRTGGRESVGLTATYAVVSAIGMVGVLSFRRQVIPWLFIPLSAYLAFGLAFVWPSSSAVRGGTVNILFAILAWSAGALLGDSFRKYAEFRRFTVAIIAFIIYLQAAICVLQIIGIPIFETTGQTAILEGGRASGTFAHPSVIGKIFVLCLVLLLPATKSKDVMSRRLASAGVAFGLLAIILSMSRANMVGAAAMILAWSLFQSRDGLTPRRFALPVIAGLLGLLFLNSILGRFDQDSGERAHFMEVAQQQFARTPVFGVGPGRYIEAVGSYDALTAQGWPVHNTFMLELVELGLVGAILFFLPFVAVAVHAMSRLRSWSDGDDHARALIAFLPALVVIGWTGWGLLAPSTLAFVSFVYAFSRAQFVRNSDSGTRQSPGARAARSRYRHRRQSGVGPAAAAM